MEEETKRRIKQETNFSSICNLDDSNCIMVEQSNNVLAKDDII